MAFKEEQWYDRKPVSNADQYIAAAVAPHAPIVRVGYTCPSDKRALVEVLQAKVTRDVVAAPAGLAQAWWTITPNGETVRRNIAHAGIVTNIVGDQDKAMIGTTLVLYPGDLMEGMTADGSTGGSCTYVLGYKLSEFDAYLYPDVQKTRPIPLEKDVQEPKKEPGIVEWVRGLFEPDPVM